MMYKFNKNLADLKLLSKKLIGYKKREIHENPRIHHELKTIFVHIPKAAGSSITKALRQLNKERNRKKSPKIAKHAKAFEIKYLLGEDVWEEYFKFAFVRNPWDLMVSSYKWWRQKAQILPGHKKTSDKIRKMSFEEFIKSKYGSYMINERYGNFFDWLTDDNKIIVDYVGKVETINQDWQKICEINNFRKIKIPHVNKSQRDNYQKYYNRDTKKIIEKRFIKSIRKFNYYF